MNPEPNTFEQYRRDEPAGTTGILQLTNVKEEDLRYILSNKIKESESFFKSKLKLDQRSKKNEEYWLGQQVDTTQLDEFQDPYVDNIIWRNEKVRVALAASRLPDIIVTPASDDPNDVQDARDLEQSLEIQVKDEDVLRMVKSGIRHHDLYYRGCIKVLWDGTIGPLGANGQRLGDIRFEVIHPERFIVDHTASFPEDGFTADNMEFIAHWVEEPLAVVIKKFPDKRDELLMSKGYVKGTNRQLQSKLKYREIWFTWYDNDGNAMEAVAWIYNDIVLGKSKNPYWDYEGIEEAVEMQPGVFHPQVTQWRNFFDRPRKPFIFFTEESLGRHPIDETTVVQQAIPAQDTVNRRGRQISEMADRSGGKLALSSAGGITEETVRNITPDPKEHIFVGDVEDVRQGVMLIPGPQPSAVVFDDLVSNRQQLDSIFSTHGTTRGETQASTSGVSKQITREGDLTAADDVVNTMVQRIIYEMANWSAHLMGLFYRESRIIKNMGTDKSLNSVTMQRDRISNLMSVRINASTTDKAARRATAMELASAALIDPFSVYEALDFPNPKEMTERYLKYQIAKADGGVSYMQKVGIEIPSTDMSADTPTDQSQGTGQQQALQDIQLLIQGEEVTPQAIDESYLETFLQFVQSDQFMGLPPEAKSAIQAYMQQIRDLVNAQETQTTTPAEAPAVV